jgi:uncharacterized protein
VHISELSNRFIKEPSEVVRAGQVVKVKVLNADARVKRIALSIKALEAATAPVARPAKRTAPPQPSVEDKLASLASKWKVR